MKEKYFSPPIEDLRIGYEYDLLGTKIIIENRYDLDLAFDQPLRVPFLTKEQIENEGWLSAYIPNITTEDDELQEGYAKYTDSRISYNLFYNKNKLFIYKQMVYNEMSGNWTADILYDGECKSINEFRYICKLLKI